MLGLLAIVLFAVAISIDSFLVGLSYGIKKIILTKRAIVIVTAFSGALLLLFMLAGDLIAGYLSTTFISILAASLLGALGIYKLIEAYREGHPRPQKGHPKNKLLLKLPIPFVPYAIEILHDPERAAKKIPGNGHNVDTGGAWALGLAMSFDAIGGGFAAALAGFPIVLTVVISVLITGFLLVFALLLGRYFNKMLAGGKKKDSMANVFNYLPGFIMIALAVWKIL